MQTGTNHDADKALATAPPSQRTGGRQVTAASLLSWLTPISPHIAASGSGFVGDGVVAELSAELANSFADWALVESTGGVLSPWPG